MPTLQLAQEAIPPQEAQHTAELLARLKAKIIVDNPTGPMRRDVHLKMHGIVKAEFVVEPNLPPELRVGVFSEPRTYRAWIRFSNASSSVKPDLNGDVRGIAIKLMGVPGEKILEQERDEQTQDFILISIKAFVAPDVEEFAGLVKAVTGSMGAKIWFLLTHWCTGWRLYKSLIQIANPLQIPYFSTTPYLFGANAVKYSVVPQITTPDTIPDDPADDYLRLAVLKQLKTGEAVFDFAVQLQTDAEAMPIEDAAREWPESISPFRKVATIRILQQDCDGERLKELGENLSFSPWHALPEHRPLGGINRARKAVYWAISTFRHESNQVRAKEPSGWEI